ncbi:MAG: hypothetical protein ACPGYV_15200 [Phycisphaeraceae bacterium]
MTATTVATANPRRTTHPRVAIVGATGAVGQEFLSVLDARDFPLGGLRLLASPRSAGKTVDFQGKRHTIEALNEDSFAGIDIALFSAGGSISKQLAQAAVDAGADAAAQVGEVVSVQVIPRPHEDLGKLGKWI